MPHVFLRPDRNRGAALLMSLAILAVLSILAITFVRLSSTERLSASNFALGVRAKMVAHAGISRAIADLQKIAIDHPYSDLADKWVFRTNDGKDVGFYPGTELDDAKFPSLPFDKDADGVFENGTGTLTTHDLVNGRAISGMISKVGDTGGVAISGGLNYGRNYGLQQYDDDGLVYKLAIRDTASKLNINGKQSSLAAILDHVGKAILEVELTDPIKGRGAAIIAKRNTLPGGQFRELVELVGLPLSTGAPLTATEVQYLESYLTCFSWSDPTTIKPDPKADPEELPVLSVEPRNPVNINTAPEGLLRALIVDLKGYEQRFVEGADVYMGAATVIDEKKETVAITWTEAGLIAKEIVAARKVESFKTWDQFKKFILGLQSKTGLTGLTDGQLDVLRANFNPNTLASRFNPCQQRAHLVAKFDLTRYSTELCFGSSGYFEIECLGLVTARKGQVVARAEQMAVVQVADIIRHTTQSDFESGKIANTRTVTHPESIIDLETTGSLFDGQIEMFVPPPTVPEFSHTTYCIKVTSSPTSKLPSNHIVTAIPDAYVDSVVPTVTNDAGVNVVKVNSSPTGLKGFKFASGSIGQDQNSIESISYCFTIPKGVLTKLEVGVKVGSDSATASMSLDPPDFSAKLTIEGFTVQLLSWQDQDSEGNTGTGSPPAQFYAPFYDKFDAVAGYSTAWKGDVTSGKLKKEGVSVFSGSSLLPDGMLSTRAMAQELGYKCTGNMPLEKGSFEFWVKMVGDGVTGSNEVLFYSLLPSAAPTQQTWEGIMNKMERWGDEIINTRVYVGHPGGAVSPYALGYTESIANIADWKEHEWHHIAVSYFDMIDHRMYVDGVLVTDTFSATKDQYTFVLGSNAPGDEFTIGGFEFSSPTAVNIFNRGTVIVAGKNERFSNTTISDFKIYTSDKIFGESGFTPDDKFLANPSTPTKWHGKFSILKGSSVTEGTTTTWKGYPVTIGSISWTEYQPTQWKTKTYNTSSSSTDTDVEVRVKVGSNGWRTVPTTASLGGDGRGYYVGETLPASTSGSDVKTVEYELTFTGSIDPFNVTPSIDDIQIALAIPAQVVIWKTR